MKLRSLILAAAALLSASALAQSWSGPYQRALDLAKAGDWPGARAEFQNAIAQRGRDESGPIRLPSPITDPILWRGGSAYSPKFGAGYSLYRLGLATVDNAERTKHLLSAVDELEAQMQQSGRSLEALYVLDQCWFLLRDADKRRAVQALRSELGASPLKIDQDILDPADRQNIAQVREASTPAPQGGPAPQGAPGVTVTPVNAADINPVAGSQTGPALTITPVVRSKYALIIGNAESRLPEGRMESATGDAAMIQTSLVQFGGYDPANVELLNNATSAQIRTVAQALAERMDEDGTVMIYFAGMGVNVAGRDWLAGVEASFVEDSASMVSKTELVRTFARKGARVFSFFQVDRPVRNGFYFGREAILDASYSQMMSTIEGGRNFSLVQAGERRGVFASSMALSLRQFQNSQGQIPIWEFAWSVIENLSNGQGLGGGAPQTPTLPWLNFLDQTSSF